MTKMGKLIGKSLNSIQFTKLVVRFFLNVGSVIGIYPVRWNTDGKYLTVLEPSNFFTISLGYFQYRLKRYTCWLVYYGGIILTRLGYIAFISYCLNTLDTTPTDQLVSFLYLGIISMGLCGHVYCISHSRPAVGHLNQLLAFNRQTSKLC